MIIGDSSDLCRTGLVFLQEIKEILYLTGATLAFAILYGV